MALNMRYKILLLDYKVKARLKTSLAFTIDFVCWILFSSYLKFKHSNPKFTVVEADKAHTLAMILILVIIIIRHRTPKCEVVEDQYLQEKLRSNKHSPHTKIVKRKMIIIHSGFLCALNLGFRSLLSELLGQFHVFPTIYLLRFTLFSHHLVKIGHCHNENCHPHNLVSFLWTLLGGFGNLALYHMHRFSMVIID